VKSPVFNSWNRSHTYAYGALVTFFQCARLFVVSVLSNQSAQRMQANLGEQWTAAMVARVLCFGTSRHAKRDFLTQGCETSKAAAVDAVAQTLREKLDL
jgi:hypothetical protein